MPCSYRPLVGTTPPAKLETPTPCIWPTCMDTAERETTLLGAAPALKESEDESMESAIDRISVEDLVNGYEKEIEHSFRSPQHEE
eukprot:scaffold41817_cov68-Phaeocystis_antarctica.AAC.2